MAWLEQWQHAVDGVELNAPELGRFCEVPDVQNGFEGETIWVPIAGDVPWFHRVQPNPGRFTFNVQGRTLEQAAWDSLYTTLKGLFTAGPHTYVVQVRGMAGQLTYTIIANGGWLVNFRTRSFSAVVGVAEQQ